MTSNLVGSDFSSSPQNNHLSTIKSLSNLQASLDTKSPFSSEPSSNNIWKVANIARAWQRLSLRRKATLFALAVGIVPIGAIGSIAHHFAARSLTQQIITDQESRTFDIAQKVSLFTNHVVSDANTIAHSPILKGTQLTSKTTKEQGVAFLNDFIDQHPLEKYDNIAVFAPNGKLLFQSQSAYRIEEQETYSDRNYFRRAISTKKAVVNDPEIHSSSGKNSLIVATPILERETNKILGVVQVQMPLTHWKSIFQYVQAESWEYRLIDTEQYVFDADETEFIGLSAEADLKKIYKLQADIETQKANGTKEVAISTRILEDQDDQEQVLASLAPISGISGVSSPGWKIALSRPVDLAFAPLRQLRLTLLLGTTGTAILVGALTTAIANRAILPIMEAAGALQKIGRGELDTQVTVKGEDELAILGASVNKMAQKLKTLVQNRTEEAHRSQRLKDLTLKLSRADSSKQVFQIALREILLALRAERAMVYRIESGGKGKIIAESVVKQHPSFLRAKTINLEDVDRHFSNNQIGKVKAVSNIYQADFDLNYLQYLETWNVKSEMIAPFATENNCHNLFIVQQCSRQRDWQLVEIDLFTQLVSQTILAWERTNLMQQQKVAREELQTQALSLLMEVEPIGQGDLTIRATVKEGEIGTIADSYNSTVESLRQIVLQVQKSTSQMAAATGSNEEFAQSLFERAFQQSEAIAAAAGRIQAMTESIQSVALNAEAMEATFREVLQTVANGDKAMDRTVTGIMDIRSTVAETANKVKRLGESSQKIAKVVNLIGGFAAQTNLLALNASLEASRAGEEEHNFATVAEEIRTLAQQSAEATTEIEKIVASIQLDTKAVFKAMEEGIERVVIGTQLVDETRQSLDQVTASSHKVNSRIAEIVRETTQEFQASQKITQTIGELAAMSNTTSSDAAQASVATKELLVVVAELQDSVSQFKA